MRFALWLTILLLLVTASPPAFAQRIGGSTPPANGSYIVKSAANAPASAVILQSLTGASSAGFLGTDGSGNYRWYGPGSGLSLVTSLTNDVLTGKGGGQTFVGDTASGGSVRLQSTTHPTKGFVYLGAGTANYFDEANNLLKLDGNLLVGTATDVAASKVRIDASKSIASGASAIWNGVDFLAATATLTGSTNITTATGFNPYVFRAPTLSAASALTVDVAATVVVAGPPSGAGAGPATITQPLALWIQSGNILMGTAGSSSPLSYAIDAARGFTGILKIRLANSNTAASDGAEMVISSNGDSAGDATLRWNVSGITDWTAGINNSAARNPWKLSASSQLNTNDIIIADYGAAEFTLAPGGGSNKLTYAYLGSALNELPATRISQHTLTGTDYALLPQLGQTSGMMVLGYYDGTNYRSALEYTNVASGFTTLKLIRSGGTLTVNSNNTIASAASATWNGVDYTASTATITGSTNITTATGFNPYVFRAPTLSAASALTVTNAATVTVLGAPSGAGAGPATITNAYALWVQAGTTRADGRLAPAQGASVASASNVTLGSDGNTFPISGTTNIDCISSTGWTGGSVVYLIFAGILTVNDSSVCSGANKPINLSAAFVTTADDVLGLVYDSANSKWQEISRSAN